MKTVILVIFILSLGLSGCMMTVRSYPYEIVVVNVGDSEIEENRVYDSSENCNYGCGFIGPNGYKGHAGPMDTPPNDVFHVHWKDAQAKLHEQKFDLRQRVKRNFRGQIVFVYQPDGTLSVEIVHPPKRYPVPPQRR